MNSHEINSKPSTCTDFSSLVSASKKNKNPFTQQFFAPATTPRSVADLELNESWPFVTFRDFPWVFIDQNSANSMEAAPFGRTYPP